MCVSASSSGGGGESCIRRQSCLCCFISLPSFPSLPSVPMCAASEELSSRVPLSELAHWKSVLCSFRSRSVGRSHSQPLLSQSVSQSVRPVRQ